MDIKHVFFDLDHTLWDFEKNSDLTFNKIFQEQKITIDTTSFLRVYKPINREFWKLYREEKISKADLRYQRLKTAFDKINYTISDDVIHQIALDYIAYLPEYSHLFDGTFEVLDYLQDKYQLHIITNGFEEVQTKKLTSSNIIHYFDKIITSESVGVKKPNVKVFHYALETSGAKSSQSIMIGDSIEADILGAINSGMHAIHCNFESENIEENGFISVKSLHEIKQYL
ncbi:MAG: noncanonical pyrimidine nucleotidase, YjjG family [Flavobacteriaceae bacterium]|nr:noncanonical pyrimidine nucleotidase, YjjG family [Flavobacteriaceae bacterium]